MSVARFQKVEKVVLFPDTSKDGNAYNKWIKKAQEFKTTINAEKGSDLADYLIKYNWQDFRKPNINNGAPKIQKAFSIDEVFETE